MEHVKYAFSLARGNPMVLLPSLLEVVIPFISSYLLIFTYGRQEFQELLMDLANLEREIDPGAGYFSEFFELIPLWWIPASIGLGIFASIIGIVSYRVSWTVFDGEVDVVAAFRFVFSRIFKYILAGIYMSLIGFGVMAGWLVLIMGSNYISPAATNWTWGLLVIFMIVVLFLISPIWLILVGEDFGFATALRETVRFTWNNAFSYIGIGVVTFILYVLVFWIPYLGTLLTAAITVVSNMALIDLYKQHKKIEALNALAQSVKT